MYFRRSSENETRSVIQIRLKYDQVLPHIRPPDILVFLGYFFMVFIMVPKQWRAPLLLWWLWTWPHSSSSFVPDDSLEPLKDFRTRNNITFHFVPTAIHPEICRYHNETTCREMDRKARNLQSRSSTTGKHKLLVILLDLVPGRSKPSKEDFEVLFNGPQNDDITPTGTIKDYFLQNSYNKYEIDPYIHEWAPADGTEAECAGGRQGVWDGLDNCLFTALDQLEALHNSFDQGFSWFDFDQNLDGFIDNVIVLHNGYNAENGADDPDGVPPSERIRSHATLASGTVWRSAMSGYKLGYYGITSAYRGTEDENIARLNVISHEFIHSFGMIDLYDIDFVGNGCGSYGLMGYPIGPGNSPENPGNIGAYTKAFLGWITPTLITSDGFYNAPASFDNEVVYKIELDDPTEYLLIENKHATGWDVEMWGGGGIVIWYVDETKPMNDSTQTRVAIVQADGRDDLENDVNLGDADDLWVNGGAKAELNDSGYPNTKSRRTGASTGIRIYDFSSNGENMSFRVGGLGGEAPDQDTPAPTIPTTPAPSSTPSSTPSSPPTSLSFQPSVSMQPSTPPSVSSQPSVSEQPSSVPSLSSLPSSHPSSQPSSQPSSRPSFEPSPQPTSQPSGSPSSKPSLRPSTVPSVAPSSSPSAMPSPFPSDTPSSFPTRFDDDGLDWPGYVGLGVSGVFVLAGGAILYNYYGRPYTKEPWSLDGTVANSGDYA